MPFLCSYISLDDNGQIYLRLHESTKSLPPICWGSRKLHVHYNSCTPTNELTMDCYVLKFVGPKPALGVSRRDIQRTIRCWLVNQLWIWWQGLGDTQRQAWELILGHFLGAKARFLSFNRTQFRAVTGLLTGHNTLRRHLHLMGLSDSPLCRRCRAGDETSTHILCACEVLATLRHAYQGSFLKSEDIKKSISLGAIWNFHKTTGLPLIDTGHNGPVD
jgi:hypothetical protein